VSLLKNVFFSLSLSQFVIKLSFRYIDIFDVGLSKMNKPAKCVQCLSVSKILSNKIV